MKNWKEKLLQIFLVGLSVYFLVAAYGGFILHDYLKIIIDIIVAGFLIYVAYYEVPKLKDNE